MPKSKSLQKFRSWKYAANRLAGTLICAVILTSCQSGPRGTTASVVISNYSIQPIPPETVNHLSLVSSSSLSAGWKSYTNSNDVTGIAIDTSGDPWTVGRGGVVHWYPQQGKYEKYTTSDGLPENYITSIAVAPSGKIWVGTSTGFVSFFSDHKWTTLDVKPGDIVTGLAVASDESVWAGSNEGVHAFDGKKWKSYTTQQGLLDNYIQSIAVASNGTVWAGTIGGVSYFDGIKWHNHRLPTGTIVSSIAQSPDQTIWFGADNSIMHFDGKGWTTFSPDNNDRTGSLTHLAVDQEGKVWFTSAGSGLTLFDAGESRLVSYPFPEVSCLAVGSNGRIWLGGFDRGITSFDEIIGETYLTGDGPVDNFIISSGMSQDGTLWFGTDQGVSHYLGETWQSYTTQDGLINNSVIAIAAAPDGSMWFGTESGISHFDGTFWTSYTTQDGIPGNHVGSIAIATDGTVWILTDKGLSQYDGSRWIEVFPPLVAGSINAVAAGADGSVWVGAQGEVARFYNQKWIPVKIPFPDTVSMAVSSNGDLWMGTQASGIFYLDGELWHRIANDNAQVISIDANGLVDETTDQGNRRIPGDFWRTYTQADGLSSNGVNAIVSGSDGSVWVATDRGISYWKQDHWSSNNTQNGVDGSLVFTILEDGRGMIWAGMPLGGLSRFGP